MSVEQYTQTVSVVTLWCNAPGCSCRWVSKDVPVARTRQDAADSGDWVFDGDSDYCGAHAKAKGE